MRPGIGGDCGTIAALGLGLTLALGGGGAWLATRADSSSYPDHLAPAQDLAAVEFEDAPSFIDLYDPSAPELAVTEASRLPCGAEETMGLVEFIDERGAGGAGGGAVIGLHGVEGADSGAGLVTLDVMILYTPAALDRCGQGAIEESILYGIACANETLRRSQVPVELRLVHHAEAVGHAESGNTGTELSWLMHDPGVDTLRNEYGADLVSLMISRGNYAGIANCGGSDSVFCGNPVVFTHEIGHNFGCNHARLPTGWSRPEMSLRPGEGAVLECNRSMEIVFGGHVRPAFYQPTDLGWSLVSSPVPQAGPIIALMAFPSGYAGQIDRIQKTVECTSSAEGWACCDGRWEPQPEPEVGIGEAFWSYKTLNRDGVRVCGCVEG
jgi:hypothetical protein